MWKQGFHEVYAHTLQPRLPEVYIRTEDNMTHPMSVPNCVLGGEFFPAVYRRDQVIQGQNLSPATVLAGMPDGVITAGKLWNSLKKWAH